MGYCSGMAFRKVGKFVGFVIGCGEYRRKIINNNSINDYLDQSKISNHSSLSQFQASSVYRRRKTMDTSTSTGIRSEGMQLNHWTW